MGRLWLFLLLAWLTQKPFLALIVVLLLSAGSYGYFTGRIFGISRVLKEWQAVRALRRAVTVTPHDLTARSELGRLLVREGRDAEALAMLAPVVERQPDLAGPRADFGLALLRSGRVEEGEQHLKESLTLDPKLRYGGQLS